MVFDPVACRFGRSMVVATFSIRKLLAPLLILFAMVFSFFFMTLSHPADRTLFEFIASKGAFSVFLVAVGWPSGIAVAALIGCITYQLVFRNGRAIWISGNRVIHLSRFYSAIPREEILGTSIGSVGRWRQPALIISLVSGKQKIVQTGAMCESPDVIIARLNSWWQHAPIKS